MERAFCLGREGGLEGVRTAELKHIGVEQGSRSSSGQLQLAIDGQRWGGRKLERAR